MVRKISLAIVTTLLAIFGIGHVRALVTHGNFACAAVAAQDTSDDDGNGDSATGDDTSTEPEKKTKTPPPSVAGVWDGALDDNGTGGSYPMEMEIKQKGKKLSGPWDASGFGGTTFTGSINSSGVMTWDMKLSRGCHLAAALMLIEPDEISAMYKAKECKGLKGDTGTFYLFLQ